MTYFPISSPFVVFTDTSGDPLESGYIYIGEANKNPITNPITVYWDSTGLYPAAQPIRTIGGYPDRNGSPAKIYVNAGAFEDYSILINDKQGRLVFSAQSARFDDIASGNTVNLIDDLRSISGYGQPIFVRGHTTIGDGGQGVFEWTDGAAPGTYTDDDGITIVPTGGDGSGAWIRQFNGVINVMYYGIDNTGSTNCTIIVQGLIDLAQSGIISPNIYFPGGDYYFEKQSGLISTCLQLAEESPAFQSQPSKIRIFGDGPFSRIIIDNSSAKTVWLSGPDGSGSETAPPTEVSGLSFVSSTCKNTTDADFITYANNYLTMTNYARIFNVGRMWRSTFKDLYFNYCNGFFTESSGEDSNNTFAQQITIEGCKSVAHQFYLINLNQAWSTTIRENTIESGNGAIKIGRSSGQSSYGVRIENNTIQGNGTTYCGIRINYGSSIKITGNYFESNRASAGLATQAIFMNNNTTESSILIDSNFFAQQLSEIDGYGSDFYHITLDEVNDSIIVKSNTFTGGNGISCSGTSNGYICDSNNKFEPVGSIYNEGIFATAVLNSALPVYKPETAWTPVISDAVTGGNIASATITDAYYVRIGDQVNISFGALNIDTTGMTAGNILYIQGLPYPAGATQLGTVLLEQVTFTDMVCAYIFGGNSAIQLRQTTSAANDLSLTVAALASGTADIFVTISYRI